MQRLCVICWVEAFLLTSQHRILTSRFGVRHDVLLTRYDHNKSAPHASRTFFAEWQQKQVQMQIRRERTMISGDIDRYVDGCSSRFGNARADEFAPVRTLAELCVTRASQLFRKQITQLVQRKLTPQQETAQNAKFPWTEVATIREFPNYPVRAWRNIAIKSFVPERDAMAFDSLVRSAVTSFMGVRKQNAFRRYRTRRDPRRKKECAKHADDQLRRVVWDASTDPYP